MIVGFVLIIAQKTEAAHILPCMHFHGPDGAGVKKGIFSGPARLAFRADGPVANPHLAVEKLLTGVGIRFRPEGVEGWSQKEEGKRKKLNQAEKSSMKIHGALLYE
jgi:hypothetical protein